MNAVSEMQLAKKKEMITKVTTYYKLCVRISLFRKKIHSASSFTTKGSSQEENIVNVFKINHEEVLLNEEK